MLKNVPTMQETQVGTQEVILEKGMATHFSMLAWRIPWTEEPGGLQSMGSQTVRLDWGTKRTNTHVVWISGQCAPHSHLLWSPLAKEMQHSFHFEYWSFLTRVWEKPLEKVGLEFVWVKLFDARGHFLLIQGTCCFQIALCLRRRGLFWTV